MSSTRTLQFAIAGSLLLLFEATAAEPSPDSFNDRLPPYAVARLGTPQLRHGQFVSHLVFSPDGKSLLSVGEGEASLSTLRLWNADDGQEKWSVRQRFASSAAFSPDGRSIAVCSGVGTVRLYHSQTGREIGKLAGDQGAVSAVAYTSDAKRLFTAGGSGKLHLWEIADGKEVRTFTGHEGQVLTLALSADGKTLASSGADGTIRLWEVETAKESLKIVLAHPTEVLALSPDGKTVFVADDGKVRRWTGKELTPLSAGEKAVQRLALSGDGRTLAIGSDGLILIADVETNKIIARVERPQGEVTALAFRADGKAIAAVGGNYMLHIWDAVTSKERFVPQGHTEAVTATAYSPKGGIIATASEDGTVRIWDATTGKELRTCAGERIRQSLLAFSEDGATLTSIGQDREIRSWNVATGNELRPVGKNEGVEKEDPLKRFPKLMDATAHAFGPKGRLLAVGRADGLVYLLEAASGKTLYVLSGHSGPVLALAFSRDGRLLATGGADHLLCVWETTTGTQLLSLAGHTGAVRAAAFSPDGRTLLSGGAEGVGLMWDITRGPQGAAVQRQTLTPTDLESCWANLLSEDGPTANGALWELTAAPEQSVPFIQERMRPLFGGDAQRAAKFIVELDDDSFEVRERASAGLAAMGTTIGPLLKQALVNTQSSEARHRLEELLSKLKETIPWARERRRVFRALTALEQSGVPAARGVLEATAKGAVEPELKQAAREAIERLGAAKQ